MTPAIFLDRDGTLITDVPYLCDAAGVRLLPGAAQAVRLFNELGFACVVVTNQSAVGRGLLTIDRLHEIHAEMNRQLHQLGTRVDGIYYSTCVPRSCDRTLIEDYDRKPGPGLLLRAARDLSLDLGQSWMIGDMISDMLAGRNAGCFGTILVRTGVGGHVESFHPSIDAVCQTLLDAARLVACTRALRAVQSGVDERCVKEDACIP
jgi:D-glycero-D-manno-heptose 1,7-bisphosphate phosphatase